MNQFNIELDWKFTLSLTPSLAYAKHLIVDRFQTNNTLICFYGLLHNAASLIKISPELSFYRSPTCRVEALHAHVNRC